HPRVRRNIERWSDVFDPVAFDEHDLIDQHPAGLDVEQTAGAHSDDLRGRRQVWRGLLRLAPSTLGPHNRSGETDDSENDTHEPRTQPAHEILHLRTIVLSAWSFGLWSVLCPWSSLVLGAWSLHHVKGRRTSTKGRQGPRTDHGPSTKDQGPSDPSHPTAKGIVKRRDPGATRLLTGGP